MSETETTAIANEQALRDKIYVIRGQHVMLDYDLAEMYGYTTKAFNQQIHRNIEKFDADGDGEDEYLIAECEGTGTGIAQYGLCIVEKTDEGYELTRYESDYFSSILEKDIGFFTYPDTNEVPQDIPCHLQILYI